MIKNVFSVLAISVLLASQAYAAEVPTTKLKTTYKNGGFCFADSANNVLFDCISFMPNEKTFDKVTIEQIYQRGWRVVTAGIDQFDRHRIYIEEQ